MKADFCPSNDMTVYFMGEQISVCLCKAGYGNNTAAIFDGAAETKAPEMASVAKRLCFCALRGQKESPLPFGLPSH